MPRSSTRRSHDFAAFALAVASCSGPVASDPSGTDAASLSDSTGNHSSPTTATASPTTSGLDASTSGAASTGSPGTEGFHSTGDPAFDLGGGFKFDLGHGVPLPLTCNEIALQAATSVGCEFWGVDLPMLGANEMAYGISVGNMTDETATITIEDMRGPGKTLRLVTEFTIGAKESQLVKINGEGGVVPGDHKVAPQGFTPAAAFRVTSTAPITAMQINPVGGGPSHFAEASLLLPRQALADSHYASSYPSTWGSWAVVVAVEEDTTISTASGAAILDAFDSWTFVPGSGNDAAFFVGSDKPVAVFAGTDCVLIPGDPWYACDHLEEQVVPLASWGTSYVGARHPPRVPEMNPEPEDVRWRIVAGVAGTTVQLQPPQPGVGATIVLDEAGQAVEFASAESFVATGDRPFMLTQFMTGCYNVIAATDYPTDCSQGATGDPYMIQVPPIEQWMTELPFLTDTSYPRDFAILMREAGTTIELACLGVVSDDHFTAIPGTNYEVGHVELDDVTGEGDCGDGAHVVRADAPIGVMVAGIDSATSYGYPGGLSVKPLWAPPPTTPPG